MIRYFCFEGRHDWYARRDEEPDLYLLDCPAHDCLPFHNGPDDRFAQEDE